MRALIDLKAGEFATRFPNCELAHTCKAGEHATIAMDRIECV
jgi:hypothetical protein